MQNFQRPENALKRARELASLGQHEDAVQALENVLRSKRHNKTWSQGMEDVALFFVEACQSVSNGRRAKDGLLQFRNMCSVPNSASLEQVMRKYLSLAEDETKRVHKETEDVAGEKAALEDDLEAGTSPEVMMLRLVHGDAVEEKRAGRKLLPVLRYNWEAYRNVLDLLRHNAKLEHLYHSTARRAFVFCTTYKRTIEFRRLCELLRLHENALQKMREPSSNNNTVSLANAETMQYHLETRFEQLKVASELELWQEAYRTIEDIHKLTSIAKKAPKASLMQIYYEKLAQVFWMSKNYLFHALSLFKILTLQESELGDSTDGSAAKSPSGNRAQDTAALVLLAALAVPVYESTAQATSIFEFDVEKERNQRMANLLGISLSPRREVLLQELVGELGVLSSVPPAVASAYKLLEKFDPLNMYKSMMPVLEELRATEAFAPYCVLLERMSLLRTLQQLGLVYDRMEISAFLKIIGGQSNMGDIESFIVGAVRNRHLRLRIDHRESMLHFEREHIGADAIRQQLQGFARGLWRASRMNEADAERRRTAEAQRLELVVRAARATAESDHTRILERKVTIERRKEEEERQQMEADEVEARRAAEAAQVAAEAERRRLKEEEERRQQEKRRKEQEERELLETQAIYAEMARKRGKEVTKEDLEALRGKDRDELFRQQQEEAEKEEREREQRLNARARRMDHLERAMREEEIEVLKESFAEERKEDRVFYDRQRVAAREAALAQHKKDTENRDRLAKTQAYRVAFEQALEARRRAVYEAKKAQQDERLARKMAEYKEKMEEERRQREIEEAEKRARIEEQILARGPLVGGDEEARAPTFGSWRGGPEDGPLDSGEPREDVDFSAVRRRETEDEAPRSFADIRSEAKPVAAPRAEPEGPPRSFADIRREAKPVAVPRAEQAAPERSFAGIRREAQPSATEREAESDGRRAGARDGPRFGGARDGPRFGGARESARDGPREGVRDGARDGARDGPREGTRDGPRFGGARDGPRDGPRFGGARDGPRDGARDGPRFGGARDGPRDGPREDARDGARDGPRFGGARDGPRDGGRDGPRFGGARDGARDGPRDGPRFGGARDGPRDGARDGPRFGGARDGPRDGARDGPRDGARFGGARDGPRFGGARGEGKDGDRDGERKPGMWRR